MGGGQGFFGALVWGPFCVCFSILCYFVGVHARGGIFLIVCLYAKPCFAFYVRFVSTAYGVLCIFSSLPIC